MDPQIETLVEAVPLLTEADRKRSAAIGRLACVLDDLSALPCLTPTERQLVQQTLDRIPAAPPAAGPLAIDTASLDNAIDAGALGVTRAEWEQIRAGQRASELAPEDEAWARGFVALCEEDEARAPGLMDREIAASVAYGSDFARERADVEAGRHPLQQP